MKNNINKETYYISDIEKKEEILKNVLENIKSIKDFENDNNKINAIKKLETDLIKMLKTELTQNKNELINKIVEKTINIENLDMKVIEELNTIEQNSSLYKIMTVLTNYVDKIDAIKKYSLDFIITIQKNGYTKNFVIASFGIYPTILFLTDGSEYIEITNNTSNILEIIIKLLQKIEDSLIIP